MILIELLRLGSLHWRLEGNKMELQTADAVWRLAGRYDATELLKIKKFGWGEVLKRSIP